jgi:hypothetical protein
MRNLFAGRGRQGFPRAAGRQADTEPGCVIWSALEPWVEKLEFPTQANSSFSLLQCPTSHHDTTLFIPQYVKLNVVSYLLYVVSLAILILSPATLTSSHLVHHSPPQTVLYLDPTDPQHASSPARYMKAATAVKKRGLNYTSSQELR